MGTLAGSPSTSRRAWEPSPPLVRCSSPAPSRISSPGRGFASRTGARSSSRESRTNGGCSRQPRSAREAGSRAGLLVPWCDSEDRDHLCLLGLRVNDVGAWTAAEPARALVVADEYPGVVPPVAVFDPDRLAFLESVGGLAHRVRVAAERPRPSELASDTASCSGDRIRRQG